MEIKKEELKLRILGIKENKAIKVAENLGYEAVIAEKDGFKFPQFMNNDFNRVNLYIKEGFVYKITFG